MKQAAPLVGLLLVGMMMGAILSLQTSQIIVPFLVQQKVVYNPIRYLSNQTFYAGQTGSLTLSNIMQIAIYINSATFTASTLASNTLLAFSSLNITLNFGSTSLQLNGLQNATKTLTLGQGVYPVSMTIAYTTLTTMSTVIRGSVAITLSTP